jgi:dynein heavy chain 2
VSIHQSNLQRGNASPFHLFSFLRTFSSIYSQKVNSRGHQSEHLHKGLDKLKEAAQLVEKLNKEAEQKKNYFK